MFLGISFPQRLEIYIICLDNRLQKIYNIVKLRCEHAFTKATPYQLTRKYFDAKGNIIIVFLPPFFGVVYFDMCMRLSARAHFLYPKQRGGSMLTELINKLWQEHDLTDEELYTLISRRTDEDASLLAEKAAEVRNKVYGKTVFMRGLIEFSSVCKNDCLYCGLRKSNCHAERYRLTKEDILSCAEEGYSLGFRTFVLQGGEDGYFTDERLCETVSALKQGYPECAVTLSVGERSRESYQRLFDAGADRYLLRHETADAEHYSKLHPPEMSLESRMRCLHDLKDIGYQTGCGFMVGSPFQTTEHIVKDLRFIKQFQPEMVGIGPFIPHKDTPFHEMTAGTAELTIYLLSIIRLLLPEVLLPATTALGTISHDGRERGIRAGANVVMPNLSPAAVRKKYSIYDNKLCTGDEAAEHVAELRRRIHSAGCELISARGDHISKTQF